MKMKIKISSYIWLISLFTLSLSSCRDNEPLRMVFEKETIQLSVGESAQLKLLNAPETPITWRVADGQIASIDQGKVTALKEGSTSIFAEAQGQTAELKLTVVSKDLSQAIHFSDENFLKCLLEKYPEIDANHDQQISYEEALKVKEINLGYDPQVEIPEGKTIVNFQGLQHFLNLERLDLTSQPVGSSFEYIEELSHLRYLRLGYAQLLPKFNTKQMPELEDLRIFGNKQIVSLDLSNNKKLTALLCQDTSIKELILTDLTELTTLNANRCELTQITWGNHPKMERIDMIKNKLTSIQVTDMPALMELHLDNNLLTKVTLAKLPSLQRLNLYNNELTQIDLNGGFDKLMFLFLFHNKLASVDLSHLPMLIQVMISENPLQKLDLSANKVIRDVTAEDMPTLEVINLKNGAYNEEAQYEVAAGNTNLKKVIVDAGDEETHLKNVFKNQPSVVITTQE